MTTPTVWKVSYTDLETRMARRPFFKHTAYAEATTREEAIAHVHGYHGFSGRYGEFRASKSPGSKADAWFRNP